MTADEIIAAHPLCGYKPATIGGMTALKGKHPETGKEIWCVYGDRSHVVAEGPLNDEQIRSLAASLAAVEGPIDRGTYLTRPPRQPNKGASS